MNHLRRVSFNHLQILHFLATNTLEVIAHLIQSDGLGFPNECHRVLEIKVRLAIVAEARVVGLQITFQTYLSG